jgi:predicted amidohydrolase YtcJ
VATADVVLTGGVVATMDPSRPRAEAVAIESGAVTAVGRAGEVGDLVGPATRVVDLRERTLLPGFQDSHVHPPSSGLERMRCDLSESKGAEAVLRSVGEYAASHPDVEWITGGGWTLSDFPGGTPGRQLLDGVAGDRPAFLTNRDGHGAWVSSAALRMAGITAETPDPVDGRIEREADGSPAGMLHEGAMDLVERLIPPTAMEEWFEAILEAQLYLHSLGITAWQDAWVLDDHLRAYAGLDERRSLTARVIGALWWDRDRGLEQVPDLIERRATHGGFGVSGDDRGRFRAPTVKIMQDGICENFTAGMIEPYLDADSGTDSDRRGLSFVDPELLKEAVTRLDAEGFQVHLHAIGDRAVREALDAIAAARDANGPSQGRHHIAHLQVVHPDDVPRFAALDVVANCQPFWAALDDQMRDLNVPILGQERVRTQYPFESLRRSGAGLSFGSDWSVTTPDPFAIIQVAMTRIPFDEPEVEPFLPQERLDLQTSLDAATRGSAFVNHLDGFTGTIREGMAADLAVADRDLFRSDPMEIGQARVDLTLVAGEAVFDRSGELS